MNDWIKHIAHNYILIIIAAVLFFAVKAVIGWFTYKHYNQKLDTLADKLDRLLEQHKTD
jgi:DNA-binding transcriptional regulator of glucitol operon